MPQLLDLREDILGYLRNHGLIKKWQKVKVLFENDPSLNTDLLEPKHRLIDSFRIDRKYRTVFICLPEGKIEVVNVTKHYRK